MQSRNELITQLHPNEPNYRIKQMNTGLFDPSISSWKDITPLSKEMRESLDKSVAYFSCTFKKVFESKDESTYKAIVKAADGLEFESVLMKNARGSWTICVSSQVGCAMGCTFCATGMMGLKRHLISDEIVDQYRLWNSFIFKKFPDTRISNIVFMGMGEPLANYVHVKEAIATIVKYTDMGPTKIMVSTVGVLPTLNKILKDPDWPDAQIAISLHSPNPERRKKIVPSTVNGFHEKFALWSHEYQKIHGNRNHVLTFEYTLINNVNDTVEDAHELAQYTAKTAVKKINVIPYNPVSGKSFDRSQQGRIDQFKKIIRGYGLDITQRKTMGDDIAAACGQLIVENKKSP